MYNLSDPQMTISDYIYDSVIDPNNPLMRIKAIFPWATVSEQFADRFYSNTNGRGSKKITIMIGLHLLRSWTNLSDEKLVAQAKTDLLFKAFLDISPDDIASLPKDDSLMTKFRNRIGVEGQLIIDQEVKKVLKKLKLIKGKKVVSDTTAITFTIPHPTDTGLVTSLIKSLSKAITKAHPTTYIKRFVERIANKGQRAYKKWVLFERKGKESAMKCLEELYGYGEDLLKKAKRARKKLQTELRKKIGSTKEKGVLNKDKDYQKKKKELSNLDQHIKLSEKVLEQTKAKLEGQKGIPDRIINYHLPSLRAIKRGKIGKDCEFGLKIFLNYEEGFITGIDKVKGNLNENKCVRESLENHKKEFGHYPRSYGYDRGLDDEKLMEDMEGQGTAMITQSKTGRKKNKHEDTRRGKKRLRERSAVEAKIGEGKRCHGWKEVRLRKDESIMMGLLNGATVMNLKRLVKMM